MISPLFESLLDSSMFLLPLEVDNDNPLEGGEMENYLRNDSEIAPQFKLQLDDKEVNLEELEDLLEYPRLNTVGELWLGRNEFSDRGVELLSNSKKLSNLEVISLAGNKLSDQALVSLANSKTLAKLKRLFVQNNFISAEGIGCLAKSEVITSLEILYLKQNPLGDKGAKALATSNQA